MAEKRMGMENGEQSNILIKLTAYSFTGSCTSSYLVVFGIGHVFGFHSAVLRRLAGELHEEQQLFKDGWVHDLQVLWAQTDGLQQGGKGGTNTADIHCGTVYCII